MEASLLAISLQFPPINRRSRAQYSFNDFKSTFKLFASEVVRLQSAFSLGCLILHSRLTEESHIWGKRRHLYPTKKDEMRSDGSGFEKKQGIMVGQGCTKSSHAGFDAPGVAIFCPRNHVIPWRRVCDVSEIRSVRFCE